MYQLEKPSDLTSKRPVHIAGASGGFTDRVRAITQLAQEPGVDAIVGDWLAENVMTVYGAGKAKQRNSSGEPTATDPLPSLEERKKSAQYASTFLQCFEPAIPHLAKNKVKLAVNAGASDTQLLAEVCDQLVRDAGYEMKVAWVEGDDVTDVALEAFSKGEDFTSTSTGQKLRDWGHKPICAQCYLGGWGIAEALRKGADIVICGRVSDAAPTIGVAAWWHGWQADSFDALAGALIAGHLIECSAFITGGYYSGFKDLMKAGKHLNLGFPIAEVDSAGNCVISKPKDTGGVVNAETVTSQLVYEISGPWYYNSDVVALLEDVKAEEIAPDRVRITGIKGSAPPPTTRVGFTAEGGYQAEFHFYLVGLDMEEKCRWMEEQARYAIGEEIMQQFSLIAFQLHGTSPINPRNQQVATVDWRVFAQAPDAEVFRTDTPEGFYRKLLEIVLQSCPGVSRSNDLRQTAAKPYLEYFVSLVPQSWYNHRVHFLFDKQQILDVGCPKVTKVYPSSQPSYETRNAVPLDQFGEKVVAPLGYIALGRSGDKASDANVGFFVRRDDEWDWLRSFLTVDELKRLLGPDEYSGNRIDRFEMGNIKAVHFLLKNHLDRGYNSCSKLDTLAKNLCEYIRSKTVPIPKRFLDRGRI